MAPSSSSKVVDESIADLQENDRVEVNYKSDKWKQAKILRKHKDGSFRISCDDGQELKHVPPRKLARLGYDSDEEGGFMLYDVVEVYDKKGDIWHGAVVQSVNRKGDMFEVLYDDGGDIARVESKKVRRPQSKAKKAGKLNQGDRVYVKPGDHEEEFAATIERVDKDGSCHVKFDDKALGKESFVPRSHIRAMSAQDIAPSPFSVGSMVEVLMNPGFMPQHFERAVVERLRDDGRCEVRLSNYFHRERGGTYIAQVQYMRFAEAFQVLKAGKKVEVMVPNQPATAIPGTGNSASVVMQGGSSFSPGIVEWVHKDGTYAIRTIATRNTSQLLCDRVPMQRIRIPGMAAGVPRTPLPALVRFGVNFALEVVAFCVFFVCAAIETSEGMHVWRHSGPKYTEFENFVEYQQNLTRAAIGADSTALGQMRQCLQQRSAKFTSGSYSGATSNIYKQGISTSHGMLPPGTVDGDELENSRNWLVFALAANAACLFVFLLLGLKFVRTRISFLTTERIDHHRLRSRTERRVRMGLAGLMVASLVLSSCALVAYSTVLNQLREYCLWGSYTHGLFDLGEYWDDLSPLQARSPYTALADAVVGIVGKTTFNLYRTLFLLLVIESSTELHKRLVATIPAMLLSVLILLKLTGAMQLLHYVQHYQFNKGEYGMSEIIDIAVVNLVFSYWFMGLLLASAIGAKTWELLMTESRIGHHPASTGEKDGVQRLEKAVNGEFGPLAQQEAEAAKLEAEIVLSSRHYPMTYALIFCNQFTFIHMAASWFCLGANIRMKDYLNSEASAQEAAGVVGSAQEGDWSKWHDIDLVVSACWAVQTTLVPLVVVLMRLLGPRVDRPTKVLPMRY